MYECTWRGERVAVKKLPSVWQQPAQRGAPSPKAQYLALVDEIRLSPELVDVVRASCLLQAIRHCLGMLQVRVLGACLEDPASACLTMELVEGGNLSERIHDRRRRCLTYLQILQMWEAALLSCRS